MSTETTEPTAQIDALVTRVDFWNETAKRRHGKPAGWQWCSLDSHDKPEDFVKVEGACPDGVISRGPRKGRPRWPKTLEIVWIRRSEVEEVRNEFEEETGICSECFGEGQTVCRSAIQAGQLIREYRACRRCGGVGKFGG